MDVDREAARVYQSWDSPLGDKLRQSLRCADGQYYLELENGRCPMWRQDGLCRIQAEQGHQALCQVCREYPRLFMDYGDFQEWGLELSCPVAAKLILQGIHAETVNLPQGADGEYDPACMAVLQESRQVALDFLEKTSLPISQALAVILLYAHSVQSALDGDVLCPLNPEQCLRDARKFARPGDIQALIDFYRRLEILTPQWNNLLCQPQTLRWDARTAAFAVYLIRRYWLQAVWDYDLICRVKLILASCITVCTLGDNFARTAQLYAKEIENDPENVEAILDAAYTHPAFTDANLLGLFME